MITEAESIAFLNGDAIPVSGRSHDFGSDAVTAAFLNGLTVTHPPLREGLGPWSPGSTRLRPTSTTGHLGQTWRASSPGTGGPLPGPGTPPSVGDDAESPCTTDTHPGWGPDQEIDCIDETNHYAGPPNTEDYRLKKVPDLISENGGTCEVDPSVTAKICLDPGTPPSLDRAAALTKNLEFFRHKTSDTPEGDTNWSRIPTEHQDMVRYAWALMVENLELVDWALHQYFHAPNSNYGDAYEDVIEHWGRILPLICEGPIMFGATSDLVQLPTPQGVISFDPMVLEAEYGRGISIHSNSVTWDRLVKAWHVGRVHEPTRVCMGISIAWMIVHELLHLAEMNTYDPEHPPPVDDPSCLTSQPAWEHLYECEVDPSPPINCDAINIVTNLFKLALIKTFPMALESQCCLLPDLVTNYASPQHMLWFDPIQHTRDIVDDCQWSTVLGLEGDRSELDFSPSAEDLLPEDDRGDIDRPEPVPPAREPDLGDGAGRLP